MPDVGEPCPVCKRPYYREEYQGWVNEGCSEFCAQVSDEDKAKFLALKPGDFGPYPCAECGGTVEDEYEPDGICCLCEDPRAKRVRGELLREALPYLPPELAKKVWVELEGGKQPEPLCKSRYDRTEPI